MSDNQNHFLNTKRNEKIEKIKNNINILEHILKGNPVVKDILMGLRNFNLEEYSKFFQSLSNKEFKCLSTHKQNSKVPIKLENLKVDPYKYGSQRLKVPSIDDVNNIVIKNMGIYNIDLNENMNIENDGQNENNNETINFDKFFILIRANIKNMMNNNSTIYVKKMKHIIKLYTTFIHMNGKIFDQDDQILLRMVKDVSHNSEENFYTLCIYWLYSEYLLCSKKVEFLRYDTLLDEIIVILNKEYPKSDVKLHTNLISNIPRYNGKFIKYIIKYNQDYISEHFEELKKQSENKVKIIDQLPYLNSMKRIYIDIVKNEKIYQNDVERNKDNYLKLMLDNFLEMTRNDSYDFNLRAIEFIMLYIYNISSNEVNKIKEFALEGLKDLLTIKDFDSEKTKNDNLIKKKFPLYFFVSNRDPEVLYSSKNYSLPNVYSEAANIVRETLNQYLPTLMKQINKFNAIQLLNQCDEKCEEIVLNIIESIYKDESDLSEEKEEKLIDDKLYRSISKYYDSFTDLIQGVINFSNKIPLPEFFTEYNFVLKRIRISMKDTSENNLNSKILHKLNDANNNNSSIIKKFGENSKSVKNKIIFYIIYFYLEDNLEVKNSFKDVVELFLNYFFKIILEEKNQEEELKNEITNLQNVLISKIKIKQFLESSYEIFAFCNTLETVNKKFIQNLIYNLIVEVLNSKINLENASIEFTSDIFDKLIEIIKKLDDIKHVNEIFISKLDNKIKEKLRAKDLILFGDI